MILEIRTYRLVPGNGAEFARVMREESVPLLLDAGIRVVSHGLSLEAEGGHEEAYLIRAFSSLSERAEQEEAFYTSAAWRQGPREAIVSRIEGTHTIVCAVSAEAVAALQC